MPDEFVKGVNLGGWLVLEQWITPGLFAESGAQDEYSLCLNGGDEAIRRLTRHRRTFITKKDFVWLKRRGVTAVRIPVGYWIFGDAAPYAATIGYLDLAFMWAEAVGLDVLVCLHGAPGSQNGEAHSGRKGAVDWQSESNIQQSIDIIGKLAERYKHSPRLWGIELLNEPAATISRRQLARYYHRAYREVRSRCTPNVRLVINDIWRPKAWRWRLHWPWHTNVWFDTHQYQIFSAREKAMPAAEHVEYTQSVVRRLLASLRRHHRLIVGEWSIALDAQSLAQLTDGLRQAAYTQYAAAQLATYAAADGWFYWTYKTENDTSPSARTAPRLTAWSFRSVHRLIGGKHGTRML